MRMPTILALAVGAILVAPALAQRGPSPLVTLETRMPEVAFNDATLEDALDFLGAFARVNLVVRWDRLADLGIERDEPVTLHTRNLRFGQVLWLVLNQVKGDGPPLAYRLDDSVLLVTSADDLGQHLVTRIYDVRDLIMPLEQVRPRADFGRTRDFVQTVNAQVAEGAVAVTPVLGRLSSGVSLWGSTNIASGAGGGAQGGGQDTAQFLFANQNNDEDDGEATEEARRQNLEDLVNLIQTAVEPDSWVVNGGRGTVGVFRDLLVIRNTPFVHQQIGGAIRE